MTDNVTGQQIITICNYSKYQDINHDSVTQTVTGAGRERDSSVTNNNNGNNENNENKRKSALTGKTGKAIYTLSDLETSDLNGHYQNWFETKTPDINRFQLREDLILYCRSRGKQYRDYWATLQTWASKRQREINEKSPDRKDAREEHSLIFFETKPLHRGLP